MKYITEYRDKHLIDELAARIKQISHREVCFMEVCGSHTMSIHRFGIKSLLPKNIRLISGPGCPVCVTGKDYIDKAIWLSRKSKTIITTFGDLIKVPGSDSSLEKARAEGADVRVVYSILDALELAESNPGFKIIFLAIGFETTAPSTASGVAQAKAKNLRNFYLLTAHKVMPPAMLAIIDDDIGVNGFLAPGHVSVITGSSIYEFIPSGHQRGVVISGFEPVDVMQSIFMLVNQVESGNFKVEIQYKRAVKPEGNLKAKKLMQQVFRPGDAVWRGLGVLPDSALYLNDEHKDFDAERVFEINVPPTEEPKGCLCGDILRGIKQPNDCKLFGNVCIPENPVGACMVSSEGACNVFYKYS
jgi:hydrogenase expression/formation protein HypD